MVECRADDYENDGKWWKPKPYSDPPGKLGPSDINPKGCEEQCPDWCHVCGRRKLHFAELWIPENAEHAERMKQPSTRFLRICTDCGRAIANVHDEAKS